MPQVFNTRKALFFIDAPCIDRCTYVRNKALHGLQTGDVRMIAEAYVAASGNFGLKLNLGLSLVQVAGIIYRVSQVATTGKVNGPIGLLISLYDLLRIHGPNSYHYMQVRRDLGHFLKDALGKEEFTKLTRIANYRTADGAKAFVEWLNVQRQRLGLPAVEVAASSIEDNVELDLSNAENVSEVAPLNSLNSPPPVSEEPV